MATPGTCGDKSYAISEVLTVLSPPTSGLVNNDFWTISSITNDIAMVAVYAVTLTISLPSFPTVTPVDVPFTLTVYDNCETALITNLGQTVTPLSYVVSLATGPSTTTFTPFSDDVA